MSDKLVLAAEPRSDVGKGASRRLRRTAGRIPGIVYGGGEDPVAITLIANELAKGERFESFFSAIHDLELEGKRSPVLIKDVQRHPSRGEIIHMDLLRVRMNVEVTIQVPVHVEGAEACVGVKESGGQIMHQITEIEVSCLPGALPEYLEVDVTGLDLGQSVHLSEVPLPEGVRIPALELGEDHDQAVVSVVEVRVREEPEDEEATGEDAAASDEASGDDAGDGGDAGNAGNEKQGD